MWKWRRGEGVQRAVEWLEGKLPRQGEGRLLGCSRAHGCGPPGARPPPHPAPFTQALTMPPWKYRPSSKYRRRSRQKRMADWLRKGASSRSNSCAARGCCKGGGGRGEQGRQGWWRRPLRAGKGCRWRHAQPLEAPPAAQACQLPLPPAPHTPPPLGCLPPAPLRAVPPRQPVPPSLAPPPHPVQQPLTLPSPNSAHTSSYSSCRMATCFSSSSADCAGLQQ